MPLTSLSAAMPFFWIDNDYALAAGRSANNRRSPTPSPRMVGIALGSGLNAGDGRQTWYRGRLWLMPFCWRWTTRLLRTALDLSRACPFFLCMECWTCPTAKIRHLFDTRTGARVFFFFRQGSVPTAASPCIVRPCCHGHQQPPQSAEAAFKSVRAPLRERAGRQTRARRECILAKGML